MSELSQGYQGHLATTEAFFYGLDSLPLFIAIVVYVPFWPARMIPTIDQVGKPDPASLEKAANSDARESGSVEAVA